MSIDVKIKNRQLFKKPLLLEDLTLGRYSCGSIDEYGRNTGKVKDGYLVIYDPKRIGRGVSLAWSKEIKNEVELSVNSISTRYDIEMFYEIIRNIMHVWKTKTFEQEGISFSESDIEKLCAEQRETSLHFLADIDRLLGAGKSAPITICAAMFPLDFEAEKLMKFGSGKDEEGYAECLHSLQSLDAYYAVPLIYKNKKKENSCLGSFAITSGTDTIFPLEAKEPLGFRDPATGRQVKCDFFAVSLFSIKKDKIVAKMTFDDFVRLADIANCPMFDYSHVFLRGISEEKMEEIANSDHTDPFA